MQVPIIQVQNQFIFFSECETDAEGGIGGGRQALGGGARAGGGGGGGARREPRQVHSFTFSSLSRSRDSDSGFI